MPKIATNSLFWSPIFGFLGVIIGAFLTFWLTLSRDRSARKHEYHLRQLEKFYSPLAGLHQEFATKVLLQAEFVKEAGAEWAQLSEQAAKADELAKNLGRPNAEKLLSVA